jgi:fructan beta-fructosidase
MELASSSDVELEVKTSGDARVAVDVGGILVSYDASEQMLTTGTIRAPLRVADGRLSLRILLDRGSVEVFAEEGAVALSLPSTSSSRRRRMIVSCSRGEVGVASARAYEMDSIWPK